VARIGLQKLKFCVILLMQQIKYGLFLIALIVSELVGDD